MSDYSTVFSTDRDMGPGGAHAAARGCEGDNNDPDALTGLHNGGSMGLTYRVKSQRPEVVSILKDVITKQPSMTHWEELPSGLGLGLSWNLLWTWNKPRLNPAHLLVWQKVRSSLLAPLV